MKKVVAIDRAFPSYSRLENSLRELGLQLVFAEDKSEDVLAALCSDAEAVMTTYTQVTEAVIRAMTCCKLIIRTGIGVDNINVAAATEKNIPVSFVPDYCREEVADHTVALLLASVRKLAYCQKEAQNNWDVKKTMGFVPRLSTCRAGILGLGGIGQLIAKRLQAFDIQIIAFDPYLPAEVFDKFNVKPCGSPDEIYATCDFIIVSGPLTPDRYHMINAQAIEKMKQTAIIVNTARGPLVDEAALVEALRNKRIAGAALDVFEQEPIVDKSIYEIENLLVTPHVAFFSAASLPDLQNKVFDEVLRAVNGDALRNCMNIR